MSLRVVESGGRPKSRRSRLWGTGGVPPEKPPARRTPSFPIIVLFFKISALLPVQSAVPILGGPGDGVVRLCISAMFVRARNR